MMIVSAVMIMEITHVSGMSATRKAHKHHEERCDYQQRDIFDNVIDFGRKKHGSSQYFVARLP
tara:strand:+ start:868 stop:1056 length:189 start_codon:yes stop_codon:yes gene_type:complete